MHWNKIILFLIILSLNYTKLIANDSDFVPKVPNNLYNGPFGRFLSYGEVKSKILRDAKFVRNHDDYGKFYHLKLRENNYSVDMTKDSITIKAVSKGVVTRPLFIVSKLKDDVSQWWNSYAVEVPSDKTCFFRSLTGFREARDAIKQKDTDIPVGALHYEWRCYKEDYYRPFLIVAEIITREGKVYNFDQNGKLTPASLSTCWSCNPKLIVSEFNFDTTLYRYLYSGYSVN